MASTQTTRTYTIPLRKSFVQAPPMRKTPRAIRAIKLYLLKHCKTEEVKLGARLNAAIWARGLTNPPCKVTVNVTIEDGVAKAELGGFTYTESARPTKKDNAPETLKDKIAAKLGAKKEDAEEPVEAGKEEAEKAPAKKPVAKKKPAKVASEDKAEE
jgi:large subunit ribosomal protein L31e